MIIRRAELADAPALSKFNQNMAFETEGIRLIPEVIDAGVKAMIEKPQMGFYLVAENQGEIAAALMTTTEWSDWRNGLFWWIQSVYVLPQYRRRGLYRLLYDKVKQLAAAETNVCGFRLYVEHENVAAQKTYRAMGMEETHYQIYEEMEARVEFLQEK